MKKKIYKIGLSMMFAVASKLSYSQQGKMVSHIIKQGETISSIARQYHTKKDDILRLNNLSDNTLLHIGQKIVIPTSKATTANTAVVNKPAPEKNQYQIMPGDNLTKIAKQHHVTEQQLKDWNGLKTDAIRAGDFLYISYTGKSSPKKEEKKVEPETTITKVEPAKKIEQQPTQTAKPIVQEKAVEKEIKIQPITVPATNFPNPKNGEDYFKKEYSSSKNTIEGLSGVFKTITGLQDKKYYVLLNNIESGSIVKVSANNKFVYAKVLGSLPDIKEDKDLTLRVSSATAAALGISENKFNAKVEF